MERAVSARAQRVVRQHVGDVDRRWLGPGAASVSVPGHEQRKRDDGLEHGRPIGYPAGAGVDDAGAQHTGGLDGGPQWLQRLRRFVVSDVGQAAVLLRHLWSRTRFAAHQRTVQHHRRRPVRGGARHRKWVKPRARGLPVYRGLQPLVLPHRRVDHRSVYGSRNGAAGLLRLGQQRFHRFRPDPPGNPPRLEHSELSWFSNKNHAAPSPTAQANAFTTTIKVSTFLC